MVIKCVINHTLLNNVYFQALLAQKIHFYSTNYCLYVFELHNLQQKLGFVCSEIIYFASENCNSKWLMSE